MDILFAEELVREDFAPVVVVPSHRRWKRWTCRFRSIDVLKDGECLHSDGKTLLCGGICGIAGTCNRFW